jgi:hypothetical protein
MGLTERLNELCPACAKLVFEGAFAEALALAWLVIVDVDAQEYAAASRESLNRAGRDDAVISLADKSFSSADELARQLRDLATNGDPCAILLILDRMLLTRSPPSSLPTLPAAAYGNGLIQVELDSALLDSMNVSKNASVCYIVRMPNDRKIAKFELQHHHPFRHVPHWMVVRQHPDHASPSVVVSFSTASAALDKAFAALVGDQGAAIYLAELDSPPEFIPRDPENKSIWVAVGLQNESQVLQEIVGHLKTALAVGADVIVFPDLVVTPHIRTEIAKWLRSENRWNPRIRRPQLILVIAGSFHVPHDGTSDYFNEAWALDGQGNTIDALTHHKICPVVLNMDETVLTEGIKEGNRISMLITADSVHALIICLDLAQSADTKLPLTKLPINWLWVPSLSGKVGPHIQQAKLMTLYHFSIVACANQGPAMFFQTGEISNSEAKMDSFVMSTGEGKPEYQEGRNWKLAVVRF